MRLVAAKIKSDFSSDASPSLPLLSCWEQTDWGEWADGWCGLVTWGVEEVELYDRKWCKVRLETDRKEGCDCRRNVCPDQALKSRPTCLEVFLHVVSDDDLGQIFLARWLNGHMIHKKWMRRSSIFCIWVKHSPSCSKCLEKGPTCLSCPQTPCKWLFYPCPLLNITDFRDQQRGFSMFLTKVWRDRRSAQPEARTQAAT